MDSQIETLKSLLEKDGVLAVFLYERGQTSCEVGDLRINAVPLLEGKTLFVVSKREWDELIINGLIQEAAFKLTFENKESNPD